MLRVEMGHLDHADPVEWLERRGDLPVVIGAVDDRVDEGGGAVVHRHEALVPRVLGDDRRRLLDRDARDRHHPGQQVLAQQRGVDDPRHEGEHGDAGLVPDLAGDGERQRAERHLGRGIGAGQGATLVRDHVHDHAVPALEHAREQVLDRQERRARIGGERLLPIRQVEGHDRGHRDVQGVVDEDVDLAEGGRRLRDHRHHLVDHAQVALDEPGLTSGRLDRVGDVLARRSLVHDHDPGAEGCHGHRGALADAASAAGHERGLSRERRPVEAELVDKIPVDRIHVRLVLLPETTPGRTECTAAMSRTRASSDWC